MSTAAPALALDTSFKALSVDSAFSAARALTTWLNRDVRLHTEGFHSAPLAEFSELAGPPEEPVVALHLPLQGDLQGDLLIALPEQIAFQLVDMLLGQPVGTTTAFGELEQSAMQETGNIVGSSFANCLARWLRLSVVPASPNFAYDLACAVLAPIAASAANLSDEVWVNRTCFHLDGQHVDWRLLLLLSESARERVAEHVQREQLVCYDLDMLLHHTAAEVATQLRNELGHDVRVICGDFARAAFSELIDPAAANGHIEMLTAPLTPAGAGTLLSVTSADEFVRFLAQTSGGRQAAVPLMHTLQETFARSLRQTLAGRLTAEHAGSESEPDWQAGPAGELLAPWAKTQVAADHELFRTSVVFKTGRATFETTLHLLLHADRYAEMGTFDVC
ncbi:MAG: hypothetical protein SF069_07990 [Phycisphaerae bacterium]|nr:hypothetical protein [Phycisphaerae bacterium]